MDSRIRIGLLLAISVGLLASRPLEAQDPGMNFFVSPEGASWGADQPALVVSDQECADRAYAAGFGEAEWRAYLSADGEEARDRIGTGPWINYYGAVIAETLDQLHSDENNIDYETGVTADGQYVPDGTPEIPPGSELSGDRFTRDGPFLCFKLPG